MLHNSFHRSGYRMLTGCIGAVIFAFGMNTLIVPLDLYTAGLLGYAQVARTLVENALGMTFQVDIANIIYYVLNIPIFYLAFKTLGKHFVVCTILYLSVYSGVSMIIPIPAEPLLDDAITCTLLGALICGAGFGFTLTCGGSLGGIDIVGLAISKKVRWITVGRFGMVANVLLYLSCFFLFSLETVIYSIIYTAAFCLVVDRFHQQNINLQVLIFTKASDPEVPHRLTEKLGRGCTCWDGKGAYTGDPLHVFCICTSKFELDALRQTVYEVDPHAFITVQEGVQIYGNYLRKLN
ncbi:MAG: YitT family protein [Oscillospiraceae bacterium]|nr:YitT family protein [Oscillospiraceae bacterium]